MPGLPLGARFQQLAFAIGVAAVILGYGAVCIRHAVAAQLATRMDRASLERSTALEPGNSAAWRSLGILDEFASQDHAAAIHNLTIAGALNPADASVWLNLANSYLAAGNVDEQRNSIRRALAAAPTTPLVASQAANMYLVEGDTERAFSLFRTVLKSGTPATATLRTCMRATNNDVHRVISEVLPGTADAAFSLMTLAIASGVPSDADDVWAYIVQNHFSIEAADAIPYVRYLVEQQKPSAATRVWSDIASLEPSFQAYLPDENRVVNGGFEEPVLNGGLDWRVWPGNDVTIEVDPVSFHGGNRSLTANFTGRTSADAVLTQYVPVTGGHTYALSAALKAQELLSANGMFLRVVDVHHQELARTEAISGTTGWKEATVSFVTPPGTEAVILELARDGRGTLIQGTVWIDDVRLEQK